ncbi:MAG: DUF4332 domain-containing protein [Chloroflexaceae bacterium]|nr:DUF4332 domain-containing protein [Chloroflexaceae bacterium]NJO07568.1 DUF4332 domain-containing protein [Chloroflexaceae bacterium]
MDYPIGEVYGVDGEMKAQLLEMGITTTYQLLERVMDGTSHRALAEQLNVPVSQITSWVNRADLMRLNGVGREMANLLEEGGVDSCKELQHRVAANLQAKLKEINNAQKIAHHAPTVTQVQSWIEQAKKLAAN